MSDSDTRDRPETLLWCPDCEDHILRSRRYDHDHDVYVSKEVASMANTDGNDYDWDVKDEDDTPDWPFGGSDPAHVGGRYQVRMSYSVDVGMTVWARNEEHAKEIVDMKADKYGAHVTDAHQTWTDVDELTAVYEDDREAYEHDLVQVYDAHEQLLDFDPHEVMSNG